MNPTRTITTLLLAVLAAPVTAQTALPIGSTTHGMTSSDAAAEFVVEVDAPGYLTVLVYGEDDADLRLVVTDGEYQVLPDGESDMDYEGGLGNERVVVRLPAAGAYLVLIEAPYGGSMAGFEVGSSFLAMASAGSEPDPDGRPSLATALSPGDSHENAIAPDRGDPWDWFSITSAEAGVLTILTRVEDGEMGDLKLEIFRDGEFREPFDYSDQDENGVLGNESVNIDVGAGETVYVRVGPSFSGGDEVLYRIVSGFIPG